MDDMSVGAKRIMNLMGKHFGGQRDLYEVMGYPRLLDANDYAEIYKRGDIAGRIVDAYPDATWREPPRVEGDAAFVRELQEIIDKFRLWRVLHRLDRLMNLGHYGVLVFGLDGGEPLHIPAQYGNYSLLYLQPHSERTAEITQWEADPTNERYGMPKMYRITTGVNWTGSGGGQRVVNVHHSRVLHVAERPLEDVSIGMPRLERVFNRLMDLDKLLGGSAEMYWQNVAMLIALVADAETDWTEQDPEAVSKQMEDMQHGLRRFLRLQGIEPKNIAPGLQGSDPGSHIDKQIDIIAGASGIPQRILLGSERGELASGQDETNWINRIAERREQFAGPTVIDGVIDKLYRFGVVPAGYNECVWDDEDSLGEEKRAEIADKRAGAIQKYMGTPGAELIVSPQEFRETLGYEGAVEQEGEEDFDTDDDEVVTQFNRFRASRG